MRTDGQTTIVFASNNSEKSRKKSMRTAKCFKNGGCRMQLRNVFGLPARAVGLRMCILHLKAWDGCSSVVNVLCYKSEGRCFDPRWCQWIFH